MADLMLLGLFDNVEIVADVVDDVRALGVQDRQLKVLSHVPYPAKFFGLKATRLWFLPFVLGGAFVGALTAYFISRITPQLYPIHVGGQALTPVPPAAIMYFEFVSLFTMVGSFLGFIVQNRFPVMTPRIYDERITDGYIGVTVRAPMDVAEKVVEVFEARGAHVVKREDAANFPDSTRRTLAFWGVVSVVGLVLLLAPLLLTYDVVRIPWIDKMAHTVAVGYQEGPRRAAPAAAIPLQGPVLINGQPATEPLPATEASIQRGEMLYAINCAICHGYGEAKEGATVGNAYFQEAPAMETRVPQLSDAAIFLTITNGKNRMPSLAENLTPGETWDIVNYLRTLSAESAPVSDADAS